MTRIDRYVAAQVVRALLGVSLALLAFAFVLEWADQRSSTIGLRGALQLAALTMPRRSLELLPFLALFGVLLGLGALAAREELTAARAAGVSVLRVLAAALLPVSFMAVAGVGVQETLMPSAEARLAVLKAERRDDSQDLQRRWARVGERWVGVNAVGSAGSVHGVFGIEFEAFELVAIWRARAVLPVEQRSVAQDYASTLLGSNDTRTQTAARLALPIRLDARAFGGYVAADATRIAWRDLRARVDALRATPSAGTARVLAHYESVLWQRVAHVPAVLLLAALAAVSVFGSVRVWSVGVRLGFGIALAVLFKYANDLLAALTLLYGWPAFASAAVPLLALLIAMAVAVRRVR